MKAQEYISRGTAQLKLPSGAECSVRKLTQFDILSLGKPPAALVEATKAAAESKKDREMSSDDLDYSVKIYRAALLKCCSPIRIGSDKLKIVEKDPWDVAPGEISLTSLEQADAKAIADEVFKISGMTKEAAKEAAPFPQEPEMAPAAPQSGEALPSSAD